MKQLSLWAAAHPGNARITIVSGHVALTVVALAAGSMLRWSGNAPGYALYWLLLIIAISAAVVYPRRASLSSNSNYFRRKSCDLLLVLCTFGLLLGYASGLPTPGAGSANAATSTAEVAEHARSARDGYRQKVRGLRNRGKHFFQNIKYRYQELSKGWQVALIILTILGGIGLGILLAALACSIACNGAEALAVVVLIVGIAGIATGAYFLIREILRKGKKR